MNLLDRYIFKSVFLTCAAAVGLFGFVLMLGNVVKDMLEYILAGQFTPATVVRLVLLLPPFVVSFALPAGILTGVLLTLGRLSADSEITAMRAAGISLTRIARPVLILGILGMVAGLYVNFDSMPRARVQYEKEFVAAVRTNPLSFIVPKTFIRKFPGAVVYVGDKEGEILRDVWFWKLDRDGRVEEFARGASGHIQFDEGLNELVFTMTNVLIEKRTGKNPDDMMAGSNITRVDRYGPQHLPLDRIFGRSSARQKLSWMTYGELVKRQEQLTSEVVPPAQQKAHALDVMKVRLTIQEKINTALAVFSFALIAVPLGIKVSRRETSANLGVAVLLGLGYYMMTVMVGWLDQHPEYRPDILFWLPNAILLALGARLFLQIDRR